VYLDDSTGTTTCGPRTLVTSVN